MIDMFQQTIQTLGNLKKQFDVAIPVNIDGVETPRFPKEWFSQRKGKEAVVEASRYRLAQCHCGRHLWW